MKKCLLLCLALTISLGILSCGDEDDDMPSAQCDDTPPTYNDEIKAIIDANCATAGCHGDGTSPGVFTSYSGLEPYITSGLFKTRVIDQRSMPPASRPLSDANYNAIRCWAEGGYLID